jgi:hypothetical protein
MKILVAESECGAVDDITTAFKLNCIKDKNYGADDKREIRNH